MNTESGALARSPTDDATETRLDLDQIQGNIIGFLKDHQYFLFLRFPNGRTSAVEQWLRALVPQVSTGAQVLDFNTCFKKLKDQPYERARLKATWLNIAFTYAGLEVLGTDGLAEFPCDFREG